MFCRRFWSALPIGKSMLQERKGLRGSELATYLPAMLGQVYMNWE